MGFYQQQQDKKANKNFIARAGNRTTLALQFGELPLGHGVN